MPMLSMKQTYFVQSCRLWVVAKGLFQQIKVDQCYLFYKNRFILKSKQQFLIIIDDNELTYLNNTFIFVNTTLLLLAN